jgi:mannose-1-phosphate guanylyltransferase
MSTLRPSLPGGSWSRAVRRETARPFEARDKPWGIVLAGGDGRRLRPFLREIGAEDRPKQFSELLGSRTLLQQTLNRTRLLIPGERTVVVATRPHDRFLSAERGDPEGPTILVQPSNRGTAAGILLPTHWIHREDPGALVAIFPSDHFVVEEYAFMAHVEEVSRFVAKNPREIALVGARPTEPDPELGWVELGPPVGATAAGAICRVRSFREKPSAQEAIELFERGDLWNTFVLVAKASSLIEVSRELLPDLDRRLNAALSAPRDRAQKALEEAYELAATEDFSRSILERCAARLSISRLPPLSWSDWGTKERVVRSLRNAGLRPPWLAAIDAPPWRASGGARWTPIMAAPSPS